MASSGSYDFSVTRDEIIGVAYQHIGAVAEGGTPTSAQVTEAARLLNMIVKLRAADGMPSWAIKRGYILPFTGSSSINTDSHVVTTYGQTTVNGAVASGVTAIVATDGTVFATGDAIGVSQDDGTMLWTTVTVSGNNLTLATATTDTVADGSYLYGYTAATDRVQKPMRIINANMMDLAGPFSWEITQVSREDYYHLGNRASTGVPNQFFYDYRPSSDTALETNGTFYVYPRFQAGARIIEFSYVRPFQDFDAASDTPDFPQAFFLPLSLELAALLGPKNGVSIQERSALFKEAAMYREMALETVTTEGSIFLEPNTMRDPVAHG